MDVKFLKGTIDDYLELQSNADEGTFYLATPTQEEREGHNRLFLGKTEITADTQIQSLIEQMNTTIGHLSDLSTTEKKTIVGAINEIVKKIGDTSSLGEKSIVDVLTELKEEVTSDKTALTVKVEDTTASTEGSLHKQYTVKQGENNVETTIDIDKVTVESTSESSLHKQYKIKQGETEAEVTIDIDKISLKKTGGEDGTPVKYTLSQGDTSIGDINIPKDLVVSSGRVIVVTEDDTEGTEQAPGTYIELTLNNESSSKIYIDVKKLIDVYKAAPEANEVQLKVEQKSDGQEISATIVNNAITTEKIQDGAVTAAKLAEDYLTEEELKEKFVEKTVVGDKGTAIVSNDPTGGLLKFTTNDEKESGIAVNDGSEGIYAQLYAKNTTTGQGARVTLDTDKAYYTKNTDPTIFTADDELVTVKQVKDIEKALTWEPFPTE